MKIVEDFGCNLANVGYFSRMVNNDAELAKVLKESGLIGNSLEIRINGKMLMHASIASQPRDDREMIVLLREMVAMLESPSVPDPEVLGVYSPK